MEKIQDSRRGRTHNTTDQHKRNTTKKNEEDATSEDVETLGRDGLLPFSSGGQGAAGAKGKKGECVLDESVKVEETLLSSYCR